MILFIQDAEAKYGMFFKMFFFLVWLVQFLKKNAIDLNFHDYLYYSSTFFN